MTDQELEYLIWVALQYEGLLPPMTEETVAFWEEQLEDYQIPPEVEKRLNENFERLRAKLRGTNLR